MESDEGTEEEGPLFAYLPPDDRLWRHPSEMRSHLSGATPAVGATSATRPTRTWSVALAAGLVGAMVATGVSALSGGFDARTTTVVAPMTRMVTPDTLASAMAVGAAAPSWPTIVDAVSPSVASVTASSSTGPRSGSAVVYSTTAQRTYLLTDAGLVSQGAGISVTFNGGDPARAYLMRSDPKTGLAMLWVPGAEHHAAVMGTVSLLHDAQPVIAVGARPTGPAGTVTGTVSGLDRTVVDPDNATSMAGLVAISASVPAGDAGGPIVDESGSVVGIATSAASSDPADAGLAFAVPVDVAMHAAAQMVAAQSVTHPWLGIVDSVDLDSATAQRMGIPGGAQIISLATGGPLAAAHLGPHDVITSLDGHPVTSPGQVTALLGTAAPGRAMAVSYRHLGRTLKVAVVVSEQPALISAAP